MNNKQEVIIKLRKRAKLTHIKAVLGIVGIAIIVLGLMKFLKTIHMSTQNTKYWKTITKIDSKLLASERYIQALEEQLTKDPTDRRILMEKNFKHYPTMTMLGSPDKLDLIISVIIKLGASFLCLYIIQIITTITKFHFQMSYHLQLIGDSLELSEKFPDNLNDILALLSPKNITIGKQSAAPSDKILEITKELAGKVSK